MEHLALFNLLESKFNFYNHPKFIENDPISIPHRFSRKEDIEISAFFTATIAWGQRISIIKNAHKLMEMMDNQPFHFLINATEKDLIPFGNFVHRTFNGEDCKYFMLSLQYIYMNSGGLETVFTNSFKNTGNILETISEFHKIFFSLPHLARSKKHISNPAKGSAAKRINMFLRWMVRNDNRGVDFGIWENIPTSALYCPLDLHTGNIARQLGLINRKQNDRKALEELMTILRKFDANDPVKYDFALFGTGIDSKK